MGGGHRDLQQWNFRIFAFSLCWAPLARYRLNFDNAIVNVCSSGRDPAHAGVPGSRGTVLVRVLWAGVSGAVCSRGRHFDCGL